MQMILEFSLFLLLFLSPIFLRFLSPFFFLLFNEKKNTMDGVALGKNNLNSFSIVSRESS